MKYNGLIRLFIDKLGVNGDDGKLRRNMLKFFLPIVLLPICIILALYFRYSGRVVQNETAKMTLRSLGQVKSNLEYRFSNVEENAIILMSSLYPYLNRNDRSDTLSQQIDDYSSINRLISNYSKRHMVNNIQLYVSGDKMYANQRDIIYPFSELKDIKRYENSLNNGNRIIWLETDNTGNSPFRMDEKNISCAVMLASAESFSELSGVLLLNIPEDKISEILYLGLNTNEMVYLVNNNGIVLSHKDKTRIGTMGLTEYEMEQVFENGSGILQDGSEIISYESFDYPDWYLIARIPKKNLFKIGGWSLYSSGLVAMIGIILVLALALILLFSTVIESTMKRVSHVVRILEIEGLGAISQEKQLKDGQATITSLESNVDNLVVTIKRLLDESYRDKIISRDAMLKALQAQINPHFLYNTLDTIKWMAMDGDTKQSVWMINSLSRYFRLSLNKGRDIVKIQDEYDLVCTYIGIQIKRFPNTFTFNTDVDERALEYQIPKLTLQPIVENSILHGLRELTGKHGIINIHIAMEKDIIIKISDNGLGMNKETIDKLLLPHSGGYGLYNVNERIRIFCGEDYGLSIVSEPGNNTTITIRLRAIK